MKYVAPIAIAACMAACTQFPELDATQTPGVADVPYPALVPLQTLTNAPEPIAQPEMIEDVETRVAALDARADRVQRVNARQASDVQRRLARLRQRAEALRQVQ